MLDSCTPIPTPTPTRSRRVCAPSSAGSRPRPIYDVLAALTQAGLVRRIEPAGSPARYEVRVDDNHHHLVCRSCGEIVDVDCAVGERPCLHASNDHGYEIDEAEVIYWGRCPGCVAADPGGQAESRPRPTMVGAVPAD